MLSKKGMERIQGLSSITRALEEGNSFAAADFAWAGQDACVPMSAHVWNTLSHHTGALALPMPLSLVCETMGVSLRAHGNGAE